MQIMVSPMETQTWFIIFTIPIILMCLPWAIRNPVSLSLPSWLVIALFGWMLGRFLFVAPPREIGSAILLQVSFFIIYLTIQFTPLPSNYLTRASHILVFATLPISLMAIFQKLGANPLPYSESFAFTDEPVQGRFLVASTFGHPNYMGSYLAPLIIVAIALFSQARGKTLQFILILTAILGTIALIAAGARAALLSVVTGTGVFLLSCKIQLNKRVFMVYFPAGFAALLAAFIILYSGEQFNDRFLSIREIISRVFYWQIGIFMWGNHPLAGMGLHQFDTQFWEYIKAFPPAQEGGSWHFALTQIVRGIRPGHMHNDHLQILVENGLVGGSLWASVWIGTFKLARKKPLRPGSSPVIAAFPAVFTAILTDAFFGFPFQLPCSGLLIWVLLGLWHREQIQ